MLDLIVSGGTTVMPTGATAVDLGVLGEKSLRSARRAALAKLYGSSTRPGRSSSPAASIRTSIACRRFRFLDATRTC